MNHASIKNEWLLHQLKKPKQPVDVVLDTDTYNEIDDQFALAYLMQSQQQLHVKAIYAAPFCNAKASTPADGMEQSYQEILHVLALMHHEALGAQVYRGATRYLPDETTPVISQAATHLVVLSQTYTEQAPLYVIAIGAITNIASALLLCPELKKRIVVIWVGGNALEWAHNREFNLWQDVAAARVLFDSGVPLVQVPCKGVLSSFTTSRAELEYHLRGKNALCDYLIDLAVKEAGDGATWTRAICDVAAIGWLLGDFMDDRWESAPIAEYDDRWARDKTRHLYRYVYHIHRDALYADLFQKLAQE